MIISVGVSYWRALLKKIRRKLKRSDRVCEMRYCLPLQCDKYPGYHRTVRLRYILFIFVMLALLIFCRGKKYHEVEMEDVLPLDALLYVKFQEKTYPAMNTSEIKRVIQEYNTNETIINNDTFECCIKWDKVILVVMVKELTQSFKFLLTSLSQVREIESALLIFSHSYYDENMNELIRYVNFCRVQQIFYPYSLQLNPKAFPGFEPNDCPHEMSVKEALEKNCTGAKTPDARGFYRHPGKAEDKHHWWWTANKVFEGIKFNKTNDTLVVFLESNLYLMEDFLHTIKYLQGMLRKRADADFISLSSPTSKRYLSAAKKKTNYVEVQFYNSTRHSSVLGFDLLTWNHILAHHDLFCDVDEYSWSKSLFHMSPTEAVGKEKIRFEVLATVLPRAYTLGHGGSMLDPVHRHQVFAKAYKIVKMQNAIQGRLFPWRFKYRYEAFKDNVDILSGGWNDPRDKQLCSNMTLKKY